MVRRVRSEGRGCGGYLKQGALVPPDLLHRSQGDAHDGEQGDPPAHHVRPSRVHVLAVAGRAVLHDAGHQDDLRLGCFYY